MRFAVFQTPSIVGDISANTDAIISALQQSNAECLVFSELFLIGYPAADLLLDKGLKTAISSAYAQLLAASKQYPSQAVAVGMPWFDADGDLVNAAALFHNGTVQWHFKQHLPNHGVFTEKRYFHCKSTGPSIWQLGGLRLAVGICEDCWHQAFLDAMPNIAPDIVLTINASPYFQGKQQWRTDIMRAVAQRTNAPVLYAHRSGGHDEWVFDGSSFVVQKNGAIATAPLEGGEPLTYDFDTDTTINAVTPIASALQLNYEILKIGLREFTKTNGFTAVLIGVSGGIDSALTLAIAVDALGAENVHGYMLPYIYTSAESKSDAQALADNLGVTLQTIAIAALVEASNGCVADQLHTATPGSIARMQQNIQARARAQILMSLANAHGHLLLATGNKSEMAMGYATMYGDMAGGFNIIKDLLKTQVYELSHWVNRQHEIIPHNILTRPPSAELAPNQRDDDTLPPYAVLDPIIRLLVEQQQTPTAIAQATGTPRATIDQVITMLNQSEFKRSQAAPGVRISKRAFGQEWRMPISKGRNIFSKG